MSKDRIQEAVEAGKQNLEAMNLIRNWCAHVTVQKHGGTGLIEMQTGLPIGHHFLECLHAPAGGMAAWDLGETAVDFYDRNCVDCKQRQPVGFPNISKLVSERNARQKLHEQEQARANQEREAKLAARESVRQDLRRTLDSLSATTMDQISELDRTRTDQAAERLVQISELAPETFRPEIIEHLFSQIAAGEDWLFDAALRILRNLQADPTCLCNAALQALRSYGAREVAAEIVEKHAASANDDLIAPALPSLIRLASPISHPFAGGRAQRPVARPLWELYKHHQSAVKDGLKALLELKDAYEVRLAARGIESLSHSDPTLLDFLPLQLAAKLVRAKHLVLGREEDLNDALDDVRSVLTRTFIVKPNETDKLFERYLEGASHENAAELYKVYDKVLRDVRFDRQEKTDITDAHRLAFRRMVVMATKATDEETVDATAGLFHGEPYALMPLAAEEISLLLGSAAVLATKLSELDAEKPTREGELYILQRMNKRSHLTNLMQCFVRWSCVAAGHEGENAIALVLQFLRALPEDNTDLRGAIFGCFDAMMVSIETLQQCLPDYYSALVGSDQLLRSYAATALGRLRENIRDSMPSLVFEAFAALLTDPYVIVHRAAVHALERFRLPESLNNTAIVALTNLILSYANDRKNDEFLIGAIDLYSRRYLTKEEVSGRIGNTLIAIMQRLTPYSVAREVRHSGTVFLDNERYAPLLLKLMGDEQAMSLCRDELIDQLRRVPRGAIYANRGVIVDLGRRLIPERRAFEIGTFIELLTSIGAWKEAKELSTAAFGVIEDNTHNKPIRLHAKLRMIASSFEEAISEGKLESITPLRNDWFSTLAEIEKDNEVNRLRRDPLRGLLGSR